jgi:VWFA-related protein
VTISFTVDSTDGQPVSGLTNDSFEIYEDGARVSPFESQRRIQPRGQKSRMYSLLLLDLSGSILRSGEFAKVQEAATAYVERVLSQSPDAQRLAVFTFDGRETISPVVGFTNDAQALKDGIFKLGVRECSTNSECGGHGDAKTCAGWLCVDESTNLNGAVIKALDTLLAAQDADTAVQFKESALVVFTDGTDQASRVSTSQTTTAVKASAAHVFTVGLGGEVDTSVLGRFGKDGYEPVADSAQLQRAFDEIAGRVNAMANRFYALDYCSPKRSGSHELKLSAKWTTPDGQTASGSLVRTFDATGFSSGCEIQ